MNVNHKGVLKLNKMERKFLRKQSKARHVLLKHEGIQAVSHPTQSLVVANGGLGNGVSRKQLLLALEKYGPVEALLMPPNKPYAFVTYGSIEESKEAYAALNGKEIIDDLGQKIFLYLNFVEKAQWKKLGLQALPPGLLVVEEIISSEDEKMLLESVKWTGDTSNQNFQKSLKYRRVKHFGYEFHYENNTVDKDKPLPGGLPDICNSILEKWLKEGYIKHKPDQLTINQYEPGHGIPAHIDTHSAFEDEIISLSLGSAIVMDFKHPEGATVQVMLPRRSLLVMTGESRYLWTHGLGYGICKGRPQPTTLPNATPSHYYISVVQLNAVHCPLQKIGCDRSRNLVDICRERQFQAFVCDALAVPIRSGSCDACISIAVIHHFATAERRVEALQEIARLLRPGGQALIYVWAMEQEYKNQKSKYLRGNRISQGDKEEINSDTPVEELLENQMPDGVSEDPALSVPSTNNIKKGGCKSRNVPNSELPVHRNRTSFHSQDVLVPWHLKGNPGKGKVVEPFGPAGCPDPSPVFHRYYHVFRDGELEASCKALGDVSILQSYYDQGNWCVILQKV
nr:alkylated DNA repair protein alkB homolog 8 [Meriones unguiculatus]